jgi:hypothetical protein
VAAILLEEMTFNTYPKIRQLLWLMFAVIAESFGYRQLNSLWRTVGLYRWLFNTESIWGEMVRTASWTSKAVGIVDSKRLKAIPYSLQSKGAGTPLLRTKYNWLFKTESIWGKGGGIDSLTGKSPDWMTPIAIESEKQKSILSSLPKDAATGGGNLPTVLADDLWEEAVDEEIEHKEI